VHGEVHGDRLKVSLEVGEEPSRLHLRRAEGGVEEHEWRTVLPPAEVVGDAAVAERRVDGFEWLRRRLAELYEHAAGVLRVDEEDQLAVGAALGCVVEEAEAGLAEPPVLGAYVAHLEGDVV
jgi:hypothetical protein